MTRAELEREYDRLLELAIAANEQGERCFNAGKIAAAQDFLAELKACNVKLNAIVAQLAETMASINKDSTSAQQDVEVAK